MDVIVYLYVLKDFGYSKYHTISQSHNEKIKYKCRVNYEQHHLYHNTKEHITLINQDIK